MTTGLPIVNLVPPLATRETGKANITHSRQTNTWWLWNNFFILSTRYYIYHWRSLYSFLWHHGMEIFFILLALCEGNPLVTSGFPSRKASNVEHWCFHWCKYASRNGWTNGWFKMSCHSCDTIVMMHIGIQHGFSVLKSMLYLLDQERTTLQFMWIIRKIFWFANFDKRLSKVT